MGWKGREGGEGATSVTLSVPPPTGQPKAPRRAFSKHCFRALTPTSPSLTMSKALLALLAGLLAVASADRALQQAPSPTGTSPVTTVPGGLMVDHWTGPGVVYPDSTAKVGDTITFSWPAGENRGVYLIPTDECPPTFSPTANGQQEIKAGVVGLAEATYTFTKPGVYYFACPVDEHCSVGGMKLKVTVS
jgi:plastocyanin